MTTDHDHFAFSAETLAGIRDYWRVHGEDYGEITAAAMIEFRRHPTWGPIVAGMPQEMQDAQHRQSHERARRAIEEGAWEHYEASVREDGASYARQGIAFEDWYDVLTMASRELVPRLARAYGAEPPRLVRALLGMQALFDRVMALMAAEYIKTKETALRESEQRLASTLASLHEGLTIVDPSGKVVFRNSAAERISGGALLLDERPLAREQYPVIRALRGEEVRELELVVRHPPADDVRISVNAAPIRDEQGATLGAVASFRDVTHVRRLEERRLQTLELELRNRRMEEASRLKSEFLANMSHELRTPLNSTLIFAKLLVDNQEGNLSAEQVKYAQAIQAAGNDLLGLVNDLLDLSKIEAGKMPVAAERISTSGLVGKLLERFLPFASEKKLDLRVSLDPACPATIDTDLRGITRILTILLSNAVKFTETGTVWLRASPRGATQIELTVEDTGIGIPADQHEVIFEAFRQAHGAANRSFGGTGLGLSIARKLATLLGGEIRLRSTVGSGSAFSLWLPVQPPATEVDRSSSKPPGAETPPAGRPHRDREAIFDGRRILLVEDDERNVFAVSAVLKATAASVDVARNGRQALDRLRVGPPIDLVLMDMMMPEMDGLEATRQIRKMGGATSLPIIALTAKAMADDRRLCLAAGANDYISKPIDVEKLLSLVRVWMPR